MDRTSRKSFRQVYSRLVTLCNFSPSKLLYDIHTTHHFISSNLNLLGYMYIYIYVYVIGQMAVVFGINSASIVNRKE